MKRILSKLERNSLIKKVTNWLKIIYGMQLCWVKTNSILLPMECSNIYN